jgi:hypothetical protein
MNSTGLLVAGGGALLLAGALLDWQWMMNNRRARRLSSLVGYGTARVFYIVIGAVALAFGGPDAVARPAESENHTSFRRPDAYLCSKLEISV